MCLLKVSVVTSLNRSATGKLFHATGPLTAKLLSPQVVVFVEHTAGTRWLIADVNGRSSTCSIQTEEASPRRHLICVL